MRSIQSLSALCFTFSLLQHHDDVAVLADAAAQQPQETANINTKTTSRALRAGNKAAITRTTTTSAGCDDRAQEPVVAAAPPACPGELVEHIIDFSVNSTGVAFQPGNVPGALPLGIQILGRRRSNRKPVTVTDIAHNANATENDLRIYDTSRSPQQQRLKQTNQGDSGEGMAVLVPESDEKTDGRDDDSAEGGVILIKFKEPAYQINSLRILELGLPTEGFVTGKGMFNEKFSAEEIRSVSSKTTTEMELTQWHNVASLKIVFRRSAALSAMNITLCQPRIPGKIGSFYRSFDGSENKGGEVGSQFMRMVPANYPGDGSGSKMISEPEMPNPRNVSNTCIAQRSPTTNDRDMSDMVWAFGQFLDHDISLSSTDPSAGDCSIKVPAGNDPISPVIPTSRTKYSKHTGKPGVARQQINGITASIDGSVVYGSDKERADELRTFKDGKLKVSGTDDWTLLPLQAADSNLPNEGRRHTDTLFLAGDVRANEHVGLLAMHTLFVREHNYLAERIAEENEGVSDEAIYQMARKIVAAEIQKITYSEFLPAIMGDHAPEFTGYDPDIDISLANEFSSALYRFGHSMLSPKLMMVANNGRQIEGIELKDAFFNPSYLLDNPKHVEFLIGGLVRQKAQEIDLHIVEDVRNFLFGRPGAGGLDLASLNIQRGRDHGIGFYNDVREAYGLPPQPDFDALTSDEQRQECLTKLYDSPERLDLWVGALAEDHVPGASIGPTLIAAFQEQFGRLMNGDKFFYKNDPDMASPEMKYIVDIDTLQLSDIIRRNTRVKIPEGTNVFFSNR